MANRSQGSKGVPLASVIALLLQEVQEKLGRIGDESFQMLIYRGDGENSVLADICMAVLKALSSRLEQGLDKLGVAELAYETECVAPDVFVGMLQVEAHAVAVTHQEQANAAGASKIRTRPESIPA